MYLSLYLQAFTNMTQSPKHKKNEKKKTNLKRKGVSAHETRTVAEIITSISMDDEKNYYCKKKHEEKENNWFWLLFDNEK